jgi:hypothetical protein
LAESLREAGSTVDIGLWKDDEELISTIAGHPVEVVPIVTLNAQDEFQQDLIPGLMPVGVVDRLKLIEIA